MSTALALPLPVEAIAAPVQASRDQQVIDMWLHGRPASTRKLYTRFQVEFIAHIAKPLRLITLQDLQSYADTLADLAPATQVLALSIVKSLFSFAARLGYLPFNPGAVLRLPKRPDELASRIMSEGQVQKLLATELRQRDHVLLLLLYASGCRVSEVHGLRWRDCTERGEGGQITVTGKGAKVRHILLPPSVWAELMGLRGEAGPDDPVFVSREGNALSVSQIRILIKSAAKKARIKAAPSPHWFRHAHATHSLERGAPVSLVAATLGHSNVAITSRYLHVRPGESSAKYLAV